MRKWIRQEHAYRAVQAMTEAEHNRPIPKFFGNRPSASAAEVFGETIGLVIYSKIFLELCLSPYS